MVLNNFEAKDGRLGAWIAAGILTGGAAIATSWCLNSRIPLLKLVTGAGSGIGRVSGKRQRNRKLVYAEQPQHSWTDSRRSR